MHCLGAALSEHRGRGTEEDSWPEYSILTPVAPTTENPRNPTSGKRAPVQGIVLPGRPRAAQDPLRQAKLLWPSDATACPSQSGRPPLLR